MEKKRNNLINVVDIKKTRTYKKAYPVQQDIMRSPLYLREMNRLLAGAEKHGLKKILALQKLLENPLKTALLKELSGPKPAK